MDAATRRELDDLRRRAYGPHGDIAADPAALARLIALEDLARPVPPPRPEPAHEASVHAEAPWADAGSAVAVAEAADSEAADREASADSETSAPPAGAGPRRPTWRAGVIATAAVAAVVVTAAVVPQFARTTITAEPAPAPVSARNAYHFVSDPGSRIVARRSILNEQPDSGSSDTLVKLGSEFGWEVAMLHTAAGSSCIVLTRRSAHRSCVSDPVLTTGGLMVAIPYTSVPKADRPVGMRTNQSIGFWLLPDNRMLMILGPSKVLAGE